MFFLFLNAKIKLIKLNNIFVHLARMFFKNILIFKKIDWLLLVAVFLLICFGLTTIYSLALSDPQRNFNLFYKQLAFAILGLGLVFLLASFDYRWLQAVSGWLYLLSVTLLILVLFVGKNLYGTTGWFVLGNFSFQPIEFAKLAVIVFLARLFVGYSYEKKQSILWFKSLAVILPVCLLAMLQPDFGSTAVIILTWFGMLWLTGLNKKHLLIFLACIVVVSTISWQFVLRDYQKDRIISFLKPSRDPLGTSYNLRQSVIAVGSGGLIGRGLSLGTQSQLHFLPTSEADFIFAAISEELGFLGDLFILLLFGLLFTRMIKNLRHTKDDFGLFLIFGFLLMFFIQMAINLGMNIGILPVTGLPLPFVSYGGTFLIISLLAVGIIQSIRLRQGGN